MLFTNGTANLPQIDISDDKMYLMLTSYGLGVPFTAGGDQGCGLVEYLISGDRPIVRHTEHRPHGDELFYQKVFLEITPGSEVWILILEMGSFYSLSKSPTYIYAGKGIIVEADGAHIEEIMEMSGYIGPIPFAVKRNTPRSNEWGNVTDLVKEN